MRRAQCIICKCGSVVAACVEPQCYSDVDWMKDVREYSKKGYKIEVLELPVFQLTRCTCVKETAQQNLFA